MLEKNDVLYKMLPIRNINEPILERVTIDKIIVELLPSGKEEKTAEITASIFNPGKELRSEEKMTVPFDAIRGILQD